MGVPSVLPLGIPYGETQRLNSPTCAAFRAGRVERRIRRVCRESYGASGMLQAETAGGKREILGRREEAQTRRKNKPKNRVDRNKAPKAKPRCQNKRGAQNG